MYQFVQNIILQASDIIFSPVRKMKFVYFLRGHAGLALRSRALEGSAPNLVSPPRDELISGPREGSKNIVLDADEGLASGLPTRPSIPAPTACVPLAVDVPVGRDAAPGNGVASCRGAAEPRVGVGAYKAWTVAVFAQVEVSIDGRDGGHNRQENLDMHDDLEQSEMDREAKGLNEESLLPQIKEVSLIDHLSQRESHTSTLE